MTITINDVAKTLNVSCGTVSRALRGDRRISERTRKSVRLAAEELGYRPAHAAKTLKMGRTDTVGIIVPDLLNPYYVELTRQIEEELSGRQLQSMIFETALQPARERVVLERLLDRRCDGIICHLTRYEPVRDIISQFWQRKMPCVICGLIPDAGHARVDGFSIDMSTGVGMAVDHLVSLGHRRMVFMASWPEQVSDSGRMFGWSHALQRHGLDIAGNDFITHYTGNQLRDGYDATIELLSRDPSVTAIIGANDFFIMGAMRALSESSLRVPEDMSVIGTDNTWIGRNWPVALTTIDQKISEEASLATRILFDRLDTRLWSDAVQGFIETDLVVRESTGPVRR